MMTKNKWTRIGRTPDTPAGLARYIIDGNRVYIWCHGTTGRRQWRWNFQTKTIQYHGYRLNKKDVAQARNIIWRIEIKEHIKLDDYDVRPYGFSRGGAVAVVLAIRYNTKPLLYAPKRAGRKLTKYEALHWTGDIVPWLPPWYARYELIRMSKFSNPYKAHMKAMKYAAIKRKEMGDGVIW